MKTTTRIGRRHRRFLYYQKDIDWEKVKSGGSGLRHNQAGIPGVRDGEPCLR